MRTIAILNIKGGVGKTTSALAISQILSDEYGKRILLVDADQQGSATRALSPESNAEIGCAELLTARELLSPSDFIFESEYGIDFVSGGFRLMEANRACLLDGTRPQQSRFRRQLRQPEIESTYDYLIVDCPPDISMASVNALTLCGEMLIPIRADKYGFDGLSYVFSTVNELRDWGEGPDRIHCFLTMTDDRTNLTKFSKELLESAGVPAMKSSIRACTKVGESSFHSPLLRYAPHCTAAEDYRALVREYLTEGETK